MPANPLASPLYLPAELRYPQVATIAAEKVHHLVAQLNLQKRCLLNFTSLFIID